jgi:type IV pilus assembly protein PilC
MVQYKYFGRDHAGKKTTGFVEAETIQAAVLQLKEKNIALLDIQEHKTNWLTKEIHLNNRVKMRDIIIFVRQFAALLEAGVTVMRSMTILLDQTENKLLKATIKDIRDKIQEGSSLSEATGEHNKIFPQVFISMLKAGEATGNLDDSLNRVGDFLERQHELKQKIISALIYPAILSCVAFFVVLFMLTFIVPTFVDMYAGMNEELPWITVFVLNISDTISGNLIFFIISLLFFVIMLYILSKNQFIKYYLDYIVFKIPIYGNFLQKSAIARFTRTFSSLFAASVPILQAMEIAEKVINNEVINRVLRESRNSLESGESIVIPMKGHWLFPPLVTQMIAIGEETGSLDKMLLKVAEFYESDVEHMTDRLKALIEPLLILFIAAVIGGIVLAIVVPMFGMFENLS